MFNWAVMFFSLFCWGFNWTITNKHIFKISTIEDVRRSRLWQLNKKLLDLFWAETHRPSKFGWNLFSSFCVSLPTNQQNLSGGDHKQKLGSVPLFCFYMSSEPILLLPTMQLTNWRILIQIPNFLIKHQHPKSHTWAEPTGRVLVVTDASV